MSLENGKNIPKNNGLITRRRVLGGLIMTLLTGYYIYEKSLPTDISIQELIDHPNAHANERITTTAFGLGDGFFNNFVPGKGTLFDISTGTIQQTQQEGWMGALFLFRTLKDAKKALDMQVLPFRFSPKNHSITSMTDFIYHYSIFASRYYPPFIPAIEYRLGNRPPIPGFQPNTSSTLDINSTPLSLQHYQLTGELTPFPNKQQLIYFLKINSAQMNNFLS